MRKLIFIFTFFLVFSLGITAIMVGAQTDPVCGNGVLEAGESCDDGNSINGDGCNDDTLNGGTCQFVCGDGAIQKPNDFGVNEKCDNALEGYCSSDSSVSCTADDQCGGSEDKCLFPCTSTCGINLLGWAWSDNFGYTSINSDNCNHLHPDVQEGNDISDICTSYPYDEGDPDDRIKVTIDTDNNISGSAWSENVGWICFGAECNNAEYRPSDPPGEATTAWARVEDSTDPNPNVTGWAKIKFLGDNGWISLSCLNDSSCDTYSYGLNLGGDFFTPHGITERKVYRNAIYGWGWNGSDSISALGWLNFSPEVSGVQPWLETRLGDIYAQRGIESPSPAGYFNATYRILGTGSIEALSSRCTSYPCTSWIDPNYGKIDFPTPLTRYSNVLGEIDINGLICQVQGAETSCVNKYDSVVKHISSLNELDEDNVASGVQITLGGKIYYVNGDLAVNSEVEFKNAPTSGFISGAGTIIVNGDLNINSKITYDNTDSLNKFKNLASASWVVKGDVVVDGAVEEIVGSFIVLGNGAVCEGLSCVGGNNNGSSCNVSTDCSGGGSCEGGSCSDDGASCNASADCSGNFNSGDSENPFSVSGLIMARTFNFERYGKYDTFGSEVIIYDGRLLANIPPGLNDFAQALPIWRDGVFSQ